MSEHKQTPEERKEAAAIRRRWITLGEVLAVIGVLISGLALWNSWSERSAAEKARAAEKAQQANVSRTLLLKPSGGGKRLALAAHDPDQAIRARADLPSASPWAFETTEQDRAEWVKRAIKKAHGRTRRCGDARCRGPLPTASRRRAHFTTPPSTTSLQGERRRLFGAARGARACRCRADDAAKAQEQARTRFGRGAGRKSTRHAGGGLVPRL